MFSQTFNLSIIQCKRFVTTKLYIQVLRFIVVPHQRLQSTIDFEIKNNAFF